MARRAQIVQYLTGLAILLLALAVLATLGQDLLIRHGWVLFPGIFVVAIAARLVESWRRRRRMTRFRSRR
ncbi:MAG: hypothetical protein MJE77_23315 [Proteobacteria bacterium]|nr:hypothetical protein [Pseudomonadota bacterium]